MRKARKSRTYKDDLEHTGYSGILVDFLTVSKPSEIDALGVT